MQCHTAITGRACLLLREAYAILGVLPQISDGDLTKAYKAHSR